MVGVWPLVIIIRYAYFVSGTQVPLPLAFGSIVVTSKGIFDLTTGATGRNVGGEGGRERGT